MKPKDIGCSNRPEYMRGLTSSRTDIRSGPPAANGGSPQGNQVYLSASNLTSQFAFIYRLIALQSGMYNTLYHTAHNGSGHQRQDRAHACCN